MKTLFRLLLLAVCSACSVGTAFSQTATPIKTLKLTANGTTTVESGHAETFLSGASATFNADSTLTLNGAFSGTPTGGTLNLSALTLTLGAQSGASLTNLNATNLASGTVAAARMPALTGDVTTSAGSVALTLATVNSNVGTFGSATAAPVLTLNGKGLVTAGSNVTITPALGSITGLGTGVATFLATPSGANFAAAIADETGTGVLVFANSPTLVTPNLGAATGTSLALSGNLAVSGAGPHAFNTTTSDAGVSLLNGSAGNNPLVRLSRDGGTDAGAVSVFNGGVATTTIKGTGESTFGGALRTADTVTVRKIGASISYILDQQGTSRWDLTNKIASGNFALINGATDYIGATVNGGVAIKGTTTNDNAAPGYVGEHVSSSVAYASRVANTDATPRNVTSISLPAGDWEVEGTLAFEGSAATATIVAGGVSLASAAFGTDYDYHQQRIGVVTTTGNLGVLPSPAVRVSLAATTTVYLVSRAFFSAGTVETYGRIRARRIR